jgi:hypothetical protein
MAKNVPPNQFCDVAGCKTKEPHTEDPVVRGLLAYFDTPVVIAEQAVININQLRESLRDDMKSDRSFAFLSRFRQIEELFHRTLFGLFAATPEELPHFLSEARPNSFDFIFKLLNERVCNGRLKLDKRVIRTVGLPDQTLWSIISQAAHVSMRAFQMANDFTDRSLQKRWFDSVVQPRVLILTNVLYKLKRGDTIEEIKKTLCQAAPGEEAPPKRNRRHGPEREEHQPSPTLVAR